MYTRKCPECQKDIEHKTEISCNYSEKQKRLCRSCCRLGKRNPFYGKTHTEENKKKILKDRDYSKYKTKEFKDKMKEMNSGNKNPMSGKSVYSVWIEKYGKEEADKRLAITKKKHSDNNSGSNNPMYGKPTPQGSGNGWKGWYKGAFFRSLRELTFMIQNDGKLKTAEKLRIPYEFNGKKRTYAPDFILEKQLIEIKPIKLHNSPNNLAKFEAAKDFCKNNGLTFLVVDVIIELSLIQQNLEHIKFQDKYQRKFEEWLK